MSPSCGFVNRQSSHLRTLSSHLTILSRSPWLLRIHEDGMARQVLGNHVRTGERYILATTDPIALDLRTALALRELACKTARIFLYELGPPSPVTDAFIRALSKLALGYAVRAQVKPFGLVPRWDEANACSVWLPTEEIVLHLSADFQVAEFAVSVNGAANTRLPMPDKQSILASLGNLPIGRHTIQVMTTAAQANQGSSIVRSIAPETIFVDVRAPIAWQQAATKQTGLRIVLEPPNALLEDLIGKRATLAVHGPAQRSATIEARLYNTSGHIADTSALGRIELPTQDSVMARVVERLSKEPLSEKISLLRASSSRFWWMNLAL